MMFLSSRYKKFKIALTRYQAAVIIALIGLAISLRFYKALVASFTYDEAFSYLTYSVKSLHTIFTDYGLPNNHILNSLIMKLSGTISESEIFLRAHSVVAAGIFMVSCIAIARRLFPFAGVVFVCVYVCFEPILFDFGTLARGYSLGLGLSFLGFWLVLKHFEKRTWTNLLSASVCFILAMGAVPTFLNPIGGFFVALVLQTMLHLLWTQNLKFRPFVQRQLPFVVYLYLPTIAGAYLWYSGIEVKPAAWPFGQLHLHDALKELFVDRWRLTFMSIPMIRIASILLALMILTSIILSLLAKRRECFIMTFTALGAVLMVVGEHYLLNIRYPNPRMWIYLFPLMVFCFVSVLYIGLQAFRWRNQAIYGLAAIVTVWHLSLIDLRATYPWKHLAYVKSALEEAWQTQENPKMCYPWYFDLPFQYYARAYKMTHQRGCDETAYSFDRKTGEIIRPKG